MRTSLIVFGVLFLLIGGLLYFFPYQEFGARTATIGTEGTSTQTSTAAVAIPLYWGIGTALAGLLLLALGFIIPSSTKVVHETTVVKDDMGDHYDVVETKENVQIGPHNQRRIRKVHHEKHVGRPHH